MGKRNTERGTEYGWDCLGCEECNPRKDYLPSATDCHLCGWDSFAYAMERSYDIHEDIRRGL